MHWKLFADLAEVAGEGDVDVAVDAEEPTAHDALAALIETYPELEHRVLTAEDELESHLNLLKNGVNVRESEGLSTPVEADDELALFPPVSGG